MKRQILALAIFQLSGQCLASGFNDGDAVILHAASHHFYTSQEFNESNSGLGIRHGTGKAFIHAGGYINSLSRSSLYAGVGSTLFEVGPVALSVLAGVVSGYTKRSVTPVVLPELSIHNGRASVIINYAPSFIIDGKWNPAVVSLSFGIGF